MNLLPTNDTFKKGDKVAMADSLETGTVFGTMYLGANVEMTVVEVEGHSGSVTIPPNKLWRIL